jgi:aryl-alcohol dehydrogenase-like predicted oxidoreductase
MTNNNSTALESFRTLGRSGLIVSPMALGTMTFAAPRWGSPDDVSEAVFNNYVDAGGNFIDTADVYSGGRSEELVGKFIAERKLRDKLVLATKFGFNAEKGNPHAGGNGRKHIYSALESSLKRLKTDYVDLYWRHVWDMITPVEEVLQTLGDLVRAGKIRYFGFSDVPAWYAVKAATLAKAFNIPAPIQPGISSIILGASKLEQLNDNLASMEISLSPENLKKLNEASALEMAFPYMFTPEFNGYLFGGSFVKSWGQN